MTLCDAGPLIALIDRREPRHDACARALDQLDLPLVTTWPAFTEAMYFLGASAGWAFQRKLWDLVADGLLLLHTPTADDQASMAQRMARYHDVPMDLPGASLIVAAERLGRRVIFMLDKDFLIYRPADGGVLEIAPS